MARHEGIVSCPPVGAHGALAERGALLSLRVQFTCLGEWPVSGLIGVHMRRTDEEQLRYRNSMLVCCLGLGSSQMIFVLARPHNSLSHTYLLPRQGLTLNFRLI